REKKLTEQRLAEMERVLANIDQRISNQFLYNVGLILVAGVLAGRVFSVGPPTAGAGAAAAATPTAATTPNARPASTTAQRAFPSPPFVMPGALRFSPPPPPPATPSLPQQHQQQHQQQRENAVASVAAGAPQLLTTPPPPPLLAQLRETRGVASSADHTPSGAAASTPDSQPAAPLPPLSPLSPTAAAAAHIPARRAVRFGASASAPTSPPQPHLPPPPLRRDGVPNDGEDADGSDDGDGDDDGDEAGEAGGDGGATAHVVPDLSRSLSAPPADAAVYRL
ncbi:hypothetical protein HK405_014985, partial [Cladochytrium tenue]